MITTEELFALNPQWNGQFDLPQDYCVYLSADRNTGKVKPTSKYSPYMMDIV